MGLPGYEFWRLESAKYWDAIEELILAAFLMGVNGGIKLLPKMALPLVKWDFINYAAIDYLHRYRIEVVQGITETTRRQSVKAIEEWLRSGEPLFKLKRVLAKTVLGPARAESIAATEVTRAVASGNLEAWRSTGVISGKKWMTARDEKVCPICGPLHGRVVEIDRGWTFTAHDIETNEDLRKALGGVTGITYLQPPAHPRCRCWLQPFVSEKLFEERLQEILS